MFRRIFHLPRDAVRPQRASTSPRFAILALAVALSGAVLGGLAGTPDPTVSAIGDPSSTSITTEPTTTVEPPTTTTTTTTTVATPTTVWPAGGASVTEQAVRIVPSVIDVVSIYNSGALKADVEETAIAAAVRADADYAVRGSASIGMTELRRGATAIQRPIAGYAFPMGTTVLPTEAVSALMSADVAGVLTDDSIVMSELTASLRGARAGDVVTLQAGSGARVDFTVGAVVADAVTGGTELLMTPDAARRIDLERKSGVVIWNFGSRAGMNQALADAGAESSRIRIRRSWDPFDPDSTLGMAETKARLGEFAYRLNVSADGSTSVAIDPAWTERYLPGGRELLDSGVRIIARCHNLVVPALRAALAEVTASGLAGTINVYDANRAGGCYNPRFNRLDQYSLIGFLSRHTWGMALDTNTIGSCQGCAPPDLDCRTVRIFRKHGFSWGGNYLTPDGMHFEYVGERRDIYPYPSRYCPNTVSDSTLLDRRTDSLGADVPVEATERPHIFADAGLVSEA